MYAILRIATSAFGAQTPRNTTERGQAMKRMLAVAAAVSALVLGNTVAAAADPPTAYPTPGPVVLPGTNSAGQDGYCAFDVRLSYLVNDEQGRTTTQSNGDVVQTFRGHLVVSLQNVETGKSLTYNTSGPGAVATHPDGSCTVDTHGTNLFYTTVRNTYVGPASVPQIFFSTGHLVFTVAAGQLNDNSAPTVAWSLNGRITDVCPSAS